MTALAVMPLGPILREAAAQPVLEVVAELFDIALMLEDYAAEGCDLDFADLAAIMADYGVAA